MASGGFAGAGGRQRGGVSALGTEERPDVIFLVEWTDLFGIERRALSLYRRDVETMRTVDSEATITKGKVEWDERTN